MKKNWFFLLISAFILFRLFIVLTIGMIDDETYHWTWAKNIAYSYYDHPGMVAWMIWPFSQIFGDHAWAIRLPGFLMFLGIVYLVYKCGTEIFNKQVGQLASLLLFVIPLWGFASLGTLPDVPLAFFWLLIFYFFWQSVRTDGKHWSVKKSWLLIGVAMGLGMNSKLACCLIGLGMGMYLILTPRVRKHLLTPWPWIATLITFAMMAPIFIWNANHEWASFVYQFGRRHNEAYGADWNRWLQFWSYQWIFMSPGIYLAMLCAFFYGLSKIKTDEKWRLIICLPLPSLAIFYYQPLMSAYKPHWSGPSYLILLFGACYLFLQSKLLKKIITPIALFFLILLNLIYIPLLTPVGSKLYALFSPANAEPWQPKWDFSNEFYGWDELGEKIKIMQAEIEAHSGKKPFFAAQRYELISQLAWATKDKVWQLTNETDQFYFEQHQDKPSLIGQDALIVNNDKYPRDPLEVAKFDTCEKTDIRIYRGDVLARTFYVYYCKNFSRIL